MTGEKIDITRIWKLLIKVNGEFFFITYISLSLCVHTLINNNLHSIKNLVKTKGKIITDKIYIKIIMNNLEKQLGDTHLLMLANGLYIHFENISYAVTIN